MPEWLVEEMARRASEDATVVHSWTVSSHGEEYCFTCGALRYGPDDSEFRAVMARWAR